jgi:hypothetical protein
MQDTKQRDVVVVVPRTEPLLLAIDNYVVVREAAAAVVLWRLLIEPDAVLDLAPLAVVGHRQTRAPDTRKPLSCATSVRFADSERTVWKNSDVPARRDVWVCVRIPADQSPVLKFLGEQKLANLRSCVHFSIFLLRASRGFFPKHWQFSSMQQTSSPAGIA